MLEYLVMIIMMALVGLVIMKTLISLVRISNSNFEYCRNETKKSCNNEDYNYCNRLKI